MKGLSWSAVLLLASAVQVLAKEELSASPDGSCGKGTGHTCKLSFYGGCCSRDGKCGSTAPECGYGCQEDFGYCSPNHKEMKRWAFPTGTAPWYPTGTGYPTAYPTASAPLSTGFPIYTATNSSSSFVYNSPTPSQPVEVVSPTTTATSSYWWYWVFPSSATPTTTPTATTPGAVKVGPTTTATSGYSWNPWWSFPGTSTSGSTSEATHVAPGHTKHHHQPFPIKSGSESGSIGTPSSTPVGPSFTSTTSLSDSTPSSTPVGPSFTSTTSLSDSTPSSTPVGPSFTSATSLPFSKPSKPVFPSKPVTPSKPVFPSKSGKPSLASSASVSTPVGPTVGSTSSASSVYSLPVGSSSHSEGSSLSVSTPVGPTAGSSSFSYSLGSSSASTPVGPTVGSSSSVSTPVGPTVGSSSLSYSSGSSSVSTPIGPTVGSSSLSYSSGSSSASTPVGPTVGSSSSSVYTPVGPTVGSSSLSYSLGSLSVSTPVGPTVGSSSLSYSLGSSSVSTPVGPTVGSSSLSYSSGSSSVSTPVGPTVGSSSLSYSLGSSSVSTPVGPTIGSSSLSYSLGSSSSVSTPAGPVLSSTTSGVPSSVYSSPVHSPTYYSNSSYAYSSSSSYPIGTGSSSVSSPISPILSSSTVPVSSTGTAYSPSYSSGTGYSPSLSYSTGTAYSPSYSPSLTYSSGTGYSPSYSHSYSNYSFTGTGSSYSSVASSSSVSVNATLTSSVSSSSISGFPSYSFNSSISSTSSISGFPSFSGNATITSSSFSSISASPTFSNSSSSASGFPTFSGNATITSSSSFSTLTTSASLTPSASANATTSSSSSSTSSTCSTAPTFPADFIPGCIPCDGQPGTDKFCGYDASSNFYKVTPKTCRVVNYELDITNTTASPDGVERLVLLVNGQMPGPVIKASWGDTLVVKVNNKLQTNGTSIHFHGMRQLGSNMEDGVPSITQCPIPPGSSMTYTFVAENYGTSWYHSHFAIQAWEGVFGPLIIDGPKTASYDVDLGTFMVQDWSHFTVDSRYDLAQNATPIPGSTTGATFGGPVLMDTGLINGKNIWLGDNGNSTPVGERLVLPDFTPGTKYLLRFVNSAIQSTFKLYLDGHTFTVISNDFVPIVPYTTNILNINIGQRYEVIVTADQPVGSYFLRADDQTACSGVKQSKDIRAIVNYVGSTATVPTSTGYNYTEECVDEPYASLVPFMPLDIGGLDVKADDTDFTVVVQANNVSLYKWYLSGTTFQSQYSDPTLLDVYKGGAISDYSTGPTDLLIELPDANQNIWIVVESPIPLPHPLHLHGHDFWILAEGSGTFSSNVTLNLSNPPRRDTALLPAAGYIVLAFVTDNPGAWLMHCHIGWHTSMGFALQFLEQEDKIKSSGGLNDSCTLVDNCAAWDSYASTNNIHVLDSGV